MTPEGLRVGRWTIPGSALEERFDTPGGPGGQHANRTRTAVTVRLVLDDPDLPEEVRSRVLQHLGPVVEATSGDSRSQWRNRSLARHRLVKKLEEAMADRVPRKPTRPTAASRARRLEEKRARGELKRSRRPPEPD